MFPDQPTNDMTIKSKGATMKDSTRLLTVLLGLLLLAAAPFSALAETKKGKDKAKTEEAQSPLSTDVGGAQIKVGGFVDGMFLFRNTNTGFGLATNFAAFPFNNTVQYYDTE